MTSSPALQLDYVHQQFPALAGDWVFMDNAGGSQTLKRVADRISEYLLTSNVQLGASYAVSQTAGQRLNKATQAVATLINADPSEVVLGGSTTLLLRILSLCLGQTFRPGDEVIVTDCDHEANIGAWVDLQKQGVVVKTWRTNPETLELDLADLAPLLTPRTRLVALTHVSNVLGTLNPIPKITQFVHEHGAMVCVDGVAYAPHRLIDVRAWDVDFYAFSFYKVYGPHQAVLYGKQEYLLAMPGINHYFIDVADTPYKFQPGNINFELSYSLLGITDYLSELAQVHYRDRAAPSLRGQLQQAFDLISAHEERLSARLLSFLNSKPNVRILGKTACDRTWRVPTLSFVVEGQDSAILPLKIDPHHIGIRYGDFYARRLIEALGLTDQNGVVRVSLVHYNTLAEVDRLITLLESLI